MTKKEYKMKKLLFVSSLALVLATMPSYSEEKAYDQGHSIEDENIVPSAYNHQACIVTDSSDVFITASFIYWQALEDCNDLGHSFPVTQLATNYGSVQEMTFKYKPGFKVAAGATLGHDNWVLTGEYTWLHFTDYSAVTVDPTLQNLAESNYYDVNVYEIRSWWKCRYDMADIELSRPFYMGTALVFKPFGSLRGGCINQYYYGTNYRRISDPLLDFFYNKQKTWLVGPRIGMDCDWIFCNYFRLVGNVAAALFYQKFNNYVELSFFNDRGFYYERVLNDKSGQLTPNLEGALGLGWGSYFGEHNSWHFDMSVLYEINYFFNQNKMHSLNEKAVQELLTYMADNINEYHYSPTYKAGDLMLHGLTVTARVDF
jgi:hypothetical protein